MEKDKKGDEIPNQKGDLQGCGKLNLQVVLSVKDRATLSFEARNKANEPNRRVVTYLFKPGSRIDPDQWPCPAITKDVFAGAQAVQDCRKRFWSDSLKKSRGEAHADKDKRRAFRESNDTFEALALS